MYSALRGSLPGGGSRLKLRLSCLEEVQQHVMGWGMHATVIGPEELRRRVADTMRLVAARYEQTRTE